LLNRSDTEELRKWKDFVTVRGSDYAAIASLAHGMFRRLGSGQREQQQQRSGDRFTFYFDHFKFASSSIGGIEL
jgi:hypothetical protein